VNWREFVFDRLNGDVALAAFVGDRIFGTVPDNPDRPYVVIRFDPLIPEGSWGEFQDMTVWVHDQPESYTRIDEILPLVRTALQGPLSVPGETGIHVDWSGDSQDLSDDARGTILRTSSYRLAGRRVA